MAKKFFTVLENNPSVMTHLASSLGLDMSSLSFHDIYSLTNPDLLALIPRPVHALLVIIPFTPSWHAIREAEDANKPEYTGKGPNEPVLWFKQTIGNACGSIGLLHCILNSEAGDHVKAGSTLDVIRKEAVEKGMWDRARVLEENGEYEKAHREAAQLGDSPTPTTMGEEDRSGQHFVAFVKGRDGHLWELEGGRKGPLDRGVLGEDEDALSEKALGLGLGKLIEVEKESGGDLRFSAIALSKSWDD